MDIWSRRVLVLLRLAMGWLMFYAGITKILNPTWSAAGFLGGAKSFTALFGWFALPGNIGWVNFLNEWGLTLIGASLIAGAFVRLSSLFGALLMLLYYLPRLEGFKPASSSFIVDQHIVYVFVFLFFAVFRAGRVGGLDDWFSRHSFFKKRPRLAAWLG